MKLELRASAKINWTLEVLSKRPDGYHDVRTIMQTIELADTITLRAADEISLSITGDADALTGQPIAQNLAYRAALLLRGATKRGAHIELEKHIPVAAGLGGGSSDAAAVLRGLRQLWEIDIRDEDLTSMAAELGSDVPFFLRGGTAIASGRGEQIEPLPDVAEQRLVIAWPQEPAIPDKTASMYSHLGPAHYTDGIATEALAAALRDSGKLAEQDIYNVFEQVLNPEGRRVEAPVRANATSGHLCGSGPAFFFLAASDDQARTIARTLRGLGLETSVTRTIASRGTLSIAELQ